MAYVWSATGLPTGLSIDASTGILSGTPAQSGSFAVAITVTDGTYSDTENYTLVIDPSLGLIVTDSYQDIPGTATTGSFIVTASGTACQLAIMLCKAGLTTTASVVSVNDAPDIDGYKFEVQWLDNAKPQIKYNKPAGSQVTVFKVVGA